MASPAIDFDFEAATTTTGCQTVCETTATHRGISQLLLGIRQGYCQAMFEELASSSPDELVDIVRENRAPTSRLTYAAEILGRDVATPAALATLVRALRNHPSPLVREGAILGLSYHLQTDAVRVALLVAARQDPSAGVRRAATEALEA